MRIVSLSIAVLAANCIVASAQDADTRYRLERTADGYVRMDTATGAMSICTERAGQLLCRLAADERDAWQDELGRLTARVEEVERRLDQIGKAPGTGELPTEEELEKGLTLMELFMRRFMGIVKELEAEGAPPRKT